MREFAITLAAVCAVGGLILAAMSILDKRGTGWRNGFVSGCFAMSMTALLGAVVAAWAM